MGLSAQSAWDRVIKPWWAKAAIGILLMISAYSDYHTCLKLQSKGKEPFWVWRSTQFLYDIGGTWLAVGVPALAGLGFVIWGAVQVSRRSQQ
jgi:hypothetical protein